MRFEVVLLAMLLGACELINPPSNSNQRLNRDIDRQRAARDSCLIRMVAQAPATEDAATVGAAASLACRAEDDQLIEVMVHNDRSGRQQITQAVLKDSVVRATRFTLRNRGAFNE
jgi:hypothetical protein